MTEVKYYSSKIPAAHTVGEIQAFLPSACVEADMVMLRCGIMLTMPSRAPLREERATQHWGNSMSLFDDISRHYEGPAGYSEAPFSFLNRSARPAADRVRTLVDSWFSRYPLSEQAALRARIRSQDDRHHLSAFFELFMHELLLRLHCEVHVHPDMNNDTTKRPDFEVTSPEGERFFVEAIIATDESETDVAARARMNVVYDALNQLDSPNFFLGMDLEGTPETPPSAKSMRAFLQERLENLDPDAIIELWETNGLSGIPRWHYQHDGWDITFFPIPKSAEARGKPSVRPIGMKFHGFRQIAPEQAIKSAVLRKAGRYGDLGRPYVIAVNAISEYGVDRTDAIEALFGQEQLEVTWPSTPGGPMGFRPTRKPDGAWISPKGPRYTRVSAILLTSPVTPWSIARVSACLYHNPWAVRAYSSVLTRFPQALLEENGHMSWLEGIASSELLEISPDWPEK
jgi:hypothetical protein